MKQLLLSAIRTRLFLIRTNKSRIQGTEQICKELQYWISNGADCDRLAQSWDVKIRMILTRAHLAKYEQLRLLPNKYDEEANINK